jgi:hypothetical protein
LQPQFHSLTVPFSIVSDFDLRKKRVSVRDAQEIARRAKKAQDGHASASQLTGQLAGAVS